MHSLEEPSIGRVQQIKALTEVDVSAKHGWRLDLLRIALLLIARPIVGPLRPVLPEVNARPKPIVSFLTRSQRVLAGQNRRDHGRIATVIRNDQPLIV